MQNFLLICLAGLSLSFQTVAQERLEGNFVAPRIPLHLEFDQSGFLIDMHQWLMDKAEVQADLTIVPGGRAKAMLEAEKVDGLYPSWVSASYDTSVLYTAPLMQVDHFIYSKPGATIFSSLADLQGRRLGLVQHYELALDVAAQENLRIDYSRNGQTLITLLLSGRVDAIILSNIEVNALQRVMNLKSLSFDSSAVIMTKYLGYVLLNNPQGAALHKRINNAIIDAQKSGSLQAYVEQAVNRFN